MNLPLDSKISNRQLKIADDYLRAMNLPNTREIDTMQERLQQVRRENFALKKEIKEIRGFRVIPAQPDRDMSTRSKTESKPGQHYLDGCWEDIQGATR